jgi:hypothetical protein
LLVPAGPTLTDWGLPQSRRRRRLFRGTAIDSVARKIITFDTVREIGLALADVEEGTI